MAKVCRSKSHNHFNARANFAYGMPTTAAPWVVDSGASHHITNDIQYFNSAQDYTGPDEISMGDGKVIPITHTGTAQLHASGKLFSLSNTLCAPKIKSNLISVSRFCKDNLTSIEFFPSTFCVKDLDTGIPLLRGQNKDGLYEWPSNASLVSSSPSTNIAVSSSSTLWHQRLGHPSFQVLKSILGTFSVSPCNSHSPGLCNSCHCNKNHRLPFFRNTIRTTCPLQVIYSDLWGPSPLLSIDKKLYYVLFVDHHTKYSWLYTIKSKTEVAPIFKNFQQLVERYFNTIIQSFYTDGGGEFVSLKAYLSAQGIQHLTSPPYTPQRVAVVERRHRHILETAKTLLHQASLPAEYWSFACQQAIYLINRMPTSVLHNKCPFEKLFCEAPNYQSLRVFGSLCYPWLRPYAHHKLEAKSKPCVYLGFSIPYHSHICYDPIGSKVYINRDVIFCETVFPFTTFFAHLPKHSPGMSWDVTSATNHKASNPPDIVPSPLPNPIILPVNKVLPTQSPTTTPHPPSTSQVQDTPLGPQNSHVHLP